MDGIDVNIWTSYRDEWVRLYDTMQLYAQLETHGQSVQIRAHNRMHSD